MSTEVKESKLRFYAIKPELKLADPKDANNYGSFEVQLLPLKADTSYSLRQ
jgi:hypothetical protein